MNQALFFYLNNLAGKSVWFDDIVIFIATYLGRWLIVSLFIFLILGKDKRKEFKMLIFSGLSIFLSWGVITGAIRFLFYFPRPFVNNSVYQLIFYEATRSSFPSGHAAMYFALAMAIFFFHKKWSILFFTGAVLIGIARIIAGIHWPIDVLGGAIIGILSSLVICKIFKISYNQT